MQEGVWGWWKCLVSWRMWGLQGYARSSELIRSCFKICPLLDVNFFLSYLFPFPSVSSSWPTSPLFSLFLLLYSHTHTYPENKCWTPVSRFPPSVSFMKLFPDYSRLEKKNKYIGDHVSQVTHLWSASYSSGKLQYKEGPLQCGTGVRLPAMNPQWST